MEPLAVAVGNQDGLRAVIADLRRDRDGSATKASEWRDQAERLSLGGSASPRASHDALPKPEQPRTTEPSNRLVRVWRWDARDWVRPNLWLKWESVQGLTPSARATQVQRLATNSTRAGEPGQLKLTIA